MAKTSKDYSNKSTTETALRRLMKNEKKIFDNILSNNFTCSICLDILKQPFGLKCEHIFCKKCIEDWTRIKQTCPMCRKQINSKPVKCERLEKLITEMSTKKQHYKGIRHSMGHQKGSNQRPPWK